MNLITLEKTLSQEEILQLLYSHISSTGQNYSKFKSIFARPGIVGEKITTVVASGKETEVIVQQNKIVIRNQTLAQEEYVVGEDKFNYRYEENNEPVPADLKQRGYRSYTPKGKIKAIVAHTVFAENVTEIQFTASWNELMVCKKDDLLAIPIGTKPEIYRIAIEEFLETYKVES
jgi:hypothetical protein